VALGQPRAVGAQDHRHVGERRHGIAERLVGQHLLGRVRQVIVATDHMADAHVYVVDDHAEVVGRRAVGAHEDPVVELAVIELHRAVDEVVHDGGARVGNAQAQGAGGEPTLPAAARVAERLLARLGGLALGVELRRRAVAVVGAAPGEQPGRGRPVEVEALGLPVARRRRSLVPVEPQPPERVHDEVDVRVGGPRLVGVLDAQDEAPGVVAREEPVEQRRAGAAHVQVPGRARGEAHADAVGHLSTARRARPPASPRRRGSGRGRS
jgi:hypothetical protein